MRRRAPANLDDGPSGTPHDPGYVAIGLSGHGGGIELPHTGFASLRTLASRSTEEDRSAIAGILVRSQCTTTQATLIAELLIAEFGSFAAALAGSAERLRRAGADDNTIEALRWCRSIVLLSLKRRALELPILGSSIALRNYLHVDMAEETRERLRTLYLNSANELILDEETATGTIDAAPLYAREIVRRAIEVGAASLILVHNHPSGSCQPSQRDVDSTVALAQTCLGLGITVLDHLIVGRNDIVSLRSIGALG